ncbi:uncharacterized protein LOC130625149 [Hydractinia symbiolongicarpus]|uniref:uncharacterized protein LOC130625149 n=1 Tax=Hydractinia symbiolongicarpus TaxID=13093 RepID=UPI00254ECF38|nr:uncharacterized protein LOC130625149 [Hydractinia symbiolongicarpus]
MHFCLNCLQGFQTIESRDNHCTYCKDNEAVKITTRSEKDEWLYYQDGQQQFKVPFVIYADFESLLIPMKENARDTKTKTLNKHVPCGWCTYSTFAYGEVPDPLTVYREEDCVPRFVNHLEDEVKRLYPLFPQKPMLPLTDEQKNAYDAAETCHICMKSFSDENRKVRDHCHYTGLYRGPAHNTCNLKYRITNHVPVIFHNLSGYDAHLFIRDIGEKYDTQDIGSIAEKTENYISFNVKIKVPIAGMGYGETYKKIEIRFIDSCRSMSSSLEKLASNLDDEHCKNLRWYFTEDDTFKLMRRKGVYSYEYMDGWRRFEETDLPPKDAFYSKLNMNEISDKEYEHAQKVWNVINTKDDETTMGTIMMRVCHANYGLDPAHFYSAPGLAWKAALKYTGVKLELLTDPDMLLLIERGVRGGITQSVHRYARANNKYMGDQYDPEVESSYLQYLDANNLCGWAMQQPLPTHGFKWVSNVKVIDEKKIDKLVSDNKHGYILEVDVDYPKELHDKHNELPFLPQRKVVYRVEKLIPNLEHKRKYMVHIGALHQAPKNGLEPKKVHCAIQFQHSAWLRDCIYHNTKLRTAAKNDFEKDFYKLMNLSVFGKTTENIRNHRNIKLVTNETAYTKPTMQPNFISGTCFSKNLMGVEMGRTGIKMNKPIYIEDFYRDIADDVEIRFDTSAYSKDDNRPLPVGKNKKVVGLMKDELGGKVMTSFITLRPKAYAYRSLTKDGGDCKAKGVKRAVTKKCINFEDYEQYLNEGIDVNKSWRCIQNKGHNIYTQEVTKIALNRTDDKRIVQADQITTLARGHYRLKEK